MIDVPKLSKERKRKFEVLENQKNILQKKFNTPVFIDIKKEKLYIVLENGDVEYIF